jgi:hypothetical protein
MDLITYLDTHFLTRAQLLDLAALGDAELGQLQRAGAVPRPSYRLALDLACDSFFGLHEEHVAREYYARGTPAWIGAVRAAPDAAFACFAQRYRARLAQLELRSSAPKLNDGLDAHLRDEWQHFLSGTYGLCTRTGLPEQIAEKEAAICVITELVEHGDSPRLRAAVALLVRASSPFAPHERARSSRRRLVEDVRLRYGLSSEN